MTTHTITPRQLEYARALLSAEPRRETAARMGVKITTVDNMRRRLRDRFGEDRSRLAWLIDTARLAQDRGGKRSTTGLRRGDPVVMIGGRFNGKRGEYVRAVNSHQIRIAIGGGTFAIRRRFVRKDAA